MVSQLCEYTHLFARIKWVDIWYMTYMSIKVSQNFLWRILSKSSRGRVTESKVMLWKILGIDELWFFCLSLVLLFQTVRVGERLQSAGFLNFEPPYQWVALSMFGQFLWVQWLWCVWEFRPAKRHLLGCLTSAVPFRKEEIRAHVSFASFKLKSFNIPYIHYWLNVLKMQSSIIYCPCS